jgi:hypothetical protein
VYHISIRGFSTSDGNLVKQVAKFCLDSLDFDYWKGLDLKFICKKYDTSGEVFAIDGEKNPSMFEIYISNKINDRDELVHTICHEMVHVKQKNSGKWIELGKSQSIWNGEKIGIEHIDYLKNPWEIEAYEYEQKLANKFKVAYNEL